MKAVTYIRWSSPEQGRGSSLERQRQDCEEHARRKGWTLVREYRDEGVSAFKGRHSSTGELAQFVADVEANAYPDGIILLTEKLDRLSREQAKTVFSWLLRVTELGVTVATVEGDRTYDRTNLDMAAIIEIVVKAQLANEESQKKASRLSAAWSLKRNRLARGEKTILTRRAPAWLRVEGTPPTFVIDSERAAVVRRVFEETVLGYGKNQIARNLNRDGVPTFGRAAGWHPSYIQKILNSTAVLGEFQAGVKPRGEGRKLVGEVVPDYFPRIIDPDLYANAVRSLAGRQRRTAGKGRRLVNLFSGLAVCGQCSSRMTFRAKGLKKRADGSLVAEDYLICDAYQRGRGCTNGHHYNYKLWESGILDPLLLDAMEDRHFASPDGLRTLEIELADSVRKRTITSEKAEAALTLFMETNRLEAKQMWLKLVHEVDGISETVAVLEKQVLSARGAVSPEEHRRRIFALRSTLDSEDEHVRFETRSRVMEAIHELVETISFSASPVLAEITTKTGVIVNVAWEEWGDQAGMAWVKMMPDSK